MLPLSTLHGHLQTKVRDPVMETRKSLIILGIRGLPAAHGGFETFAEQLGLYLVKRGWRVSVYCQHDVETVTRRLWTDSWNGIERINIAVSTKGPLGTLDFDWRSIGDATRRDGTCLVLGYNSAILLPYLRLRGKTVLTNMDGIEWRRAKWSRPIRAWFWLNEWVAAWTSHQLIADHPAIADHLATRRSRKATVMIPYGANPIEAAPIDPIAHLGLTPDRYFISIARIEPENNILPIVQAFSRRKRGAKLVVLGKLESGNAYHRAVQAMASEDVLFPGAIYDPPSVSALRFHARAYLHGHTVGGTNPSLVEALWAGNAVIAHDNAFNRWTAGEAQFFFDDVASCDAMITKVLDEPVALAEARGAARLRATACFGWTGVLEAYENALLAAGDRHGHAPRGALTTTASA